MSCRSNFLVGPGNVPFSFSGMHAHHQHQVPVGAHHVAIGMPGGHLQQQHAQAAGSLQHDRHAAPAPPSVVTGPPRLRENHGVSRMVLLVMLLLMAGVTATTTIFVATTYFYPLERSHVRRSLSDDALIAGAVAGAAAGAQAGGRASHRSLLLRRLAVLRTNERGEAALHDLLSAFPEWATTGASVETSDTSRIVVQLAAALSELARERMREPAD